MDNKTKPALNMRYYNKEIDDDLPYVGHLDYDEETGFISVSYTHMTLPTKA